MTDLSFYKSGYGTLAMYAYGLSMMGFTKNQIENQIESLKDGDPETNPIFTPFQVHNMTQDITPRWLYLATILLRALESLGFDVDSLDLSGITSLSELYEAIFDVVVTELATTYSLDVSGWTEEETITFLLLLAETKADGLDFTTTDFSNMAASDIIEEIINTAGYNFDSLPEYIQSYLTSLGISVN